MTIIPEHCTVGAPQLSSVQVAAMASELCDGWHLEGEERIARVVSVRDFQAALVLVNEIGAVAQAENHHPDLSIMNYNTVRIELTTHDAGGLTANDFVIARYADSIIDERAWP